MRIVDIHHYFLTSLEQSHVPKVARHIAKILMIDLYGINNIEREDNLDVSLSELDKFIQRLNAGEPIQYVTGKSFFYEYEFFVDKHVLIPRPETEELVHLILQEKNNFVSPSILDIGTGSGCIPITLKKKWENSTIHATDVSQGALEVAKKNATSLGTDIHFYLNNILDENTWNELPSFEIIVSNPPYIIESEKKVMPRHVLDWEPHLALFSDDSALTFYDVISDFAKIHLKENGLLFFELNEFHADDIEHLLIKKGFKNVSILEDMQGKKRLLRAENYTNPYSKSAFN